MAERYGTDLTGLGGYEGGVNSEQGAPLLSTSTDGETAILFGSSALRSIHGGITNGDFAIVPDESDVAISATNPLPYFTWDNSAGTAFSAIMATDNAFVNNNQTVRILVGTAITSGTATLSRIEPIGATGGVGNAFLPFATFSANNAAGSGVKVSVQYQFLESDQATVIGSTLAGAEFSWDGLISGAPDTLYATTSGYATPMNPLHNAPAGAEFIKMTVKFRATAAGGTGFYVVGSRSIDIVDVGFSRGNATLIINEDSSIDDFAAGAIEQLNGTIEISSGLSDIPGAENASVYVGVDDYTYPVAGKIVLDANSGPIALLAAGGVTMDSSLTVAGNITSSSTNTITGHKIRATSGTDASLTSTDHGFQIGDSSGLNLRMDNNEIMAINNGVASNLLLQNDGGLTSLGGGLGVTGNIDAGGSIASVTLIQALGVFRSIQASTTDNAFTARTNADANPRFAVDCGGVIEWGTGGTRDTNLYRSSASALTTNGELNVGNGAATITSSGAFLGTNISLSGTNGLRHDEPATTTQTSSAAIWVTVSGTNRQLRRNSSSARYKTNIVDADEVVLDAARKVKPRHYESTIEDEAGATRLGFIAEEIHDAGLTHAVGYDAEGKPETIDPVALIAALWHRVNDLEKRLETLEAE
jgi:hypothetical protein